LGGSGVVTVNIYQRSGTPGDYAYTYVNQVTVNPSGTSATDYPTVQILKGLPQVAQAMSGGHVDRYYLSGLAGVYDRDKATVIDQSGNISGASIVLQPAVTINGGVSTNAGANLGGVTISAYVKNTAFEYVNEVTANTSGLYSISIPANSNTILRAAKSGYAEQWYDRKDVSSNADVLNAARNNVDFKLVQLVTVSGNVSAVSGGGAISGARVAFYTPSDVYVTESFTNNLGEYTTEVPANASYYIQVTTNGTHFPQWYQSAYGYGDRKSYAVSAGNITGLNFGLYTQGALVGTVKDTGGSAIGGVTVSAYVAGSDYTYVHALKTGANGAFSLDVPVGVSLVLQAVTANQFLGFADGSWYYDNTTSVVSSASAKVFTSAQSGLTFVLDRRWKVAGRVTLDPAASPAGARAELYNWPDSGLTWDFRGGVTLDSSGAYEITGTGNAGFQALLRVSLNNYVPAFYKDKNNVNALVTANDRLVVPLLTTTNAGTVTLNLAGGISGTVTALDGSGTVTINVEDLRGNYFTSVTRNGGGAYTVPNLPSGNWLVRAAQDGTVAEYFGETASTANAAAVRVKAGEITNNINISIAKEWTISGKITDQNNSAAISGALVQVYFVTEPNSWFWVASANTDASGEYTLRGGYSNKQNNPTRIFLQISASAAGYTETTTNVIDVAVGQAYTDKNYALEGAAYVRGTVVNVSANTTVTINAFEKGSNFVWVGEITINGNDAASVAYVLPIKANKDLVIRAAASGYEDLWYDQKISSADAETVAQAVGTTKDAVNFNFAGHKRWLISGVIKDTDGLPLGGLSVNVFVRDSDYAGPDGGSVQTGADGRFSLQIAPTKDLVLQASTANPYIGYPTGTYYKENTAGVISSADAASLAYSAGDQDLDFKIARFWLLRGEVTPKDIEAVVDLYEYDGADINWAKNKGWVTANSNGAYEIRGTGNVTVNIRAATGNYIAAGINQTTLRPENTYTHNFNLTLGASISGRVTVNGSGTVTISVQDTDGNWLAFVTRNGTGDYSIPRVPAGARLVYAQKDNCVAEYYGETTSTKNASRLNLAAGQTTDNINIEIDREWTIAGKVETSGGQPVSDAEVDVWRSLSDWDYIGRAKTDSSGQYIVTGGYNSLDVYVRVSVNGYETQYYNDQYTENKANTINMIPGAQKTDVNFILKQVWKISGVVQTDGKGLASVRVVLYEYSNTENIIAETGTNTDGYYELVSSNPVSVDVSIFYAKDAYVTADLKERITVTLGGSPIYKDINMVLLAPPVHPLPPGQSVLDTVRSGPNPADPEKGPIHIGFILDSAARARVKVYTLGGELVFQDDRYFPAGYGEFVWSGANLYDRRLPNGVYLAYVEIDTGQEKLRKVLKIAILR
jgi:protocatechuate 3,4-dioxygenase beta subunit